MWSHYSKTRNGKNNKTDWFARQCWPERWGTALQTSDRALQETCQVWQILNLSCLQWQKIVTLCCTAGNNNNNKTCQGVTCIVQDDIFSANQRRVCPIATERVVLWFRGALAAAVIGVDGVCIQWALVLFVFKQGLEVRIIYGHCLITENSVTVNEPVTQILPHLQFGKSGNQVGAT